MKRVEVIAQLELECLPEFRKIADSPRSRHPSFRIHVGSGSVGGNTEFQGHNVYIECDRTGGWELEPNCVGLEVCVKHLDSDPRLCSLDVCWGGDDNAPCETGDIQSEEIAWNDAALRLIRDALPGLGVELAACLEAWEDAYPGT